jgi:hypothetical protein
MLRKALAVLALIPLALGAGQQEEFEVLLEDMIEKVSPFRQGVRLGAASPVAQAGCWGLRLTIRLYL